MVIVSGKSGTVSSRKVWVPLIVNGPPTGPVISACDTGEPSPQSTTTEKSLAFAAGLLDVKVPRTKVCVIPSTAVAGLTPSWRAGGERTSVAGVTTVRTETI